MFEQLLRCWQRWMCCWLPGGDEPDKNGPAQDRNQRTSSTASETEAADVDAVATWRPTRGEPPVTKPQADDLTVIRGIGPAIARKLDAR